MNIRNDASETVRRFYAAVDKKPHNRAALSSFFAPEYKDHNRPVAPSNVPDSEVMLALFDQLNRGFPDARHEIVLLEPIGDGRAVVYWKFSGTHAGPFLDRPPSRHREITGPSLAFVLLPVCRLHPARKVLSVATNLVDQLMRDFRGDTRRAPRDFASYFPST